MELSNEQAMALLSRLAGRDEQALRELQAKFGRRIYAFALNRLHDPDEAEAAVSDTLYEVWKNPAAFRGDARFSTWLLGIARYKVLTALRQRHPEYEEYEDDTPSPDLCAFDTLAERERRDGVLRCMSKLADMHRECLHLVFYEDLSLAEIAAVQQVPENTVKTRLFHARQKIRNCLERLLRDETA